MKGILEFDLESQEELEEFQAAQKGSINKMLIDTVYDDVFRPHIKYGVPILPDTNSKMQELTDEQLAVIEAIWSKIYDHFNRYND